MSMLKERRSRGYDLLILAVVFLGIAMVCLTLGSSKLRQAHQLWEAGQLVEYKHYHTQGIAYERFATIAFAASSLCGLAGLCVIVLANWRKQELSGDARLQRKSAGDAVRNTP